MERTIPTLDIDGWVEAGIISRDQADEIRAFCCESEEPHRPATSTLAREILGYVGAALLVVAAVILASQIWDEISRAQQILLAGSAAAVLVVVGLVFGRNDPGSPMIRVSRVALLLATIPVGITAALIADTWVDQATAAFVGFATATVFSVIVYLRDSSWTQHLAMSGAIVGIALTFAPAMGLDTYLWVTGPILVALGAVWLVLVTLGALRPRMLGELVGVSVLGLGSVLFVNAANPGGAADIAVLGSMIAVSIGLIAVGAILDRPVWIGGGMIGLLVYVPWLVNDVFDDTIGVPIGLAISGAVLIGTATWLRRR